MLRTFIAAGILLALVGALLSAQNSTRSRDTVPDASDAASRAFEILAWGDWDGDGLDDAFARDVAGRDRLLRNAGDGTFEDVSDTALACLECASADVVWIDADGDGVLDVYALTAEGTSRLLLNLDGVLQDVADAAGLSEAIDEVAKNYTEAELRTLRKGSPFTEKMTDKVIRGVLLLAAELMRKHPRVTKLPAATELPNTYIFRDALCAYLLTLRWISVGGARNVKPEKLRNDMVDVSFAAYATYFEGPLTADKKLSQVYEEAKYLLDSVFT